MSSGRDGTLAMAATRRLAGLLALGLLAGCFGGPQSPGSHGAGASKSKCQIGASQSSVLITEWPAAEKANLEALVSANGGAVAVEFTGCAMKLLPECRLAGSYAWRRTTPSSDVVEISNEADLYAKLPLGAVSLAGELKRSGALYVKTVVSGQRQLDGMDPEQVPVAGGCASATHLVAGVAVGAFELTASRSTNAKGSTSVAGYGSGGGGMSSSSRLVRSAGSESECANATEEGPAGACGSPVQAFLAPIPGRAETGGAPGTVRVDFVSGDQDTRWDVIVDDDASCTTPCAEWVDPDRPIVLKARGPQRDEVRVSRFGRDDGPQQVTAHGRKMGRFVTGITFTSFGGMAVIAGIGLTAVGCATDNSGLCTGGIITGLVGAGVVGGALYLMLTSSPKAKVRPLFPRATIGSAEVVVGPGAISGRF